jgi:hypothetical protein
MSQTLRRLPDGSTTYDVQEYLTTWKHLAERVEKRFPGYVVASFDPGLRLTRWVTNQNGTSRSDDSLEISVAAANTLLKATSFLYLGPDDE